MMMMISNYEVQNFIIRQSLDQLIDELTRLPQGFCQETIARVSRVSRDCQETLRTPTAVLSRLIQDSCQETMAKLTE